MRMMDGEAARAVVILDSDPVIQHKIMHRAQQAGLFGESITLEELYELDLSEDAAAGYFVATHSLNDAYARAIRHICLKSPASKVVAMIDDNDSRLAVGLFRIGATDVLLKPFSHIKLLEMIETLQKPE